MRSTGYTMNQTEIYHLWRIAQGVEDPRAYAKSALKEMGVDYDEEQERINARHADEGCACVSNRRS